MTTRAAPPSTIGDPRGSHPSGMRGTVAGLPSPSPLADTLPTMLREDAMARALCSGLDEVLAPVLLTLDAFPAYLDLATVPEDLLPWLGRWVAMTVDRGDDQARQRNLLRQAGRLHAVGGTADGIAQAVEAALGVPVEVTENGGAAWSPRPGDDLPGEPGPALLVTVRPGTGATVDVDRLDGLVAQLKPAHVQHRVQVIDP